MPKKPTIRRRETRVAEKNNMPTGQKHLLQCHCILPQYRNLAKIVFHKFEVFSIIRDDDSVIEKIVNCNNCGVGHRVYDICKSELLFKNEESSVALKKEDFKLSLPSSLYELLNNYEKQICDFEQAQFIIDEKKWGEKIILTREEVEDKFEGKLLNFLAEDKFRVESYSMKEYHEF